MDGQPLEDTSAAADCKEKKENRDSKIHNPGVSDEKVRTFPKQIIEGSWLLQVERIHPMNQPPGNRNWLAPHPVSLAEPRITYLCAS
jgi:hypothetical protein